MADALQRLSGTSDRGAQVLGLLPTGDFFSLGGILATWARTPGSIAPWTLSAAVLIALASWDPLARGGAFDATLLGLAAYELLIALTRTESRRSPDRRVSRG